MEPPDETLVAIVATTVSFLVVVPFLIKWWPRVHAKADDGRKRAGQDPRSARPASVAPATAATSAPGRVPPTSERRSGTSRDVPLRRSSEDTKAVRPGPMSGGRIRSPRPGKNN